MINLTTREIATCFYFLLFLIYVLINKGTRYSLIALLKSIFLSRLIIPVLLVISYILIITIFFSELPIWNCKYIKDICVWTFVAGFPQCFNGVNHEAEDHLSKNIIDNFKFGAVAEYITGLFPFSLLAEFVIQPVIVILVLVSEYCKTKSEYNRLPEIIDNILALFYLLLFVSTINKAIIGIKELEVIDILISFLIPITLTALFLPIIYLFSLFAKYEIVWYRMNNFAKDDNKVLRKRFIRIIKLCGLSYNRISLFKNHYLFKLYNAMTEEQFSQLMAEFKNRV